MTRHTAWLSLLLAACATATGVVPAGQDRYMVARTAGSGFSNPGLLKAEVLREADAYCAAKGKTFEVLNLIETQPPYIFGRFPRSQIEFRCVDRK